MELWHPNAEIVIPSNASSGSYRVDCPYKLVLHTTESYNYYPSTQDYFGHQSYPHFTIDETIYQHFPIDGYSLALYNASGGVETNAAKAVQIEIVWKAGQIHSLPDVILGNVADVAGWLIGQGLIQVEFPIFLGSSEAFGENAPTRFDPDSWYVFNGICGHQHVPENDHWDPGAFPVDRLVQLLTNPEEEEVDQQTQDAIKHLDTLFDKFCRGISLAVGGVNNSGVPDGFHGAEVFGQFVGEGIKAWEK